MSDRRTRIVALALAALVAAAFAPAAQNGFVLLDDQTYIVANPHLRGGFTAEALRWAFGESYASNWSPLTWLSHLLDVRLFGLDPRPHHLESVLLHAANAVLLFLALRGLTGRLWASALAAALFGAHPLRVESVAWAAARKDLLAGLCWMLALGAWVRYARRPSAARYGAVLAALALGLMAKPTLVTLPFVLLLLDWWPLGRLRPRRDGSSRSARLVAEKIPLFLLAAASAALTWRAQASWGAMDYLGDLSLAERCANALVSYVAYLGTAVWPAGLAVYYPHPGHALGAARPVAAALLLLALSALALAGARRRPWLAAGWLWYLGTLVPMIGLVQVGAQARADRYTYLPLIGVALAAAWSLADVAGRRPRLRTAAAVLALAALCALAAASRAQTALWRDDRTLFGHAAAVTRGNWLAEMNLGAAFGAQGEHAAALEHFEAALRIRPDYPLAAENARRAREALAGEGALRPPGTLDDRPAAAAVR
jgi:tetratricopeptide (TPR) repeat protein